MKSFNEDGKGLRAAYEIACESEALAARLRISLTSTSSEGIIFDAMVGGYLKRTKRLFLLRLVLFSVKTAVQHAFGFCFGCFFKTKLPNSRLTKLKIR